MQLPQWVVRRLHAACVRAAASRAPDFIIGDAAAPYLRRWWLMPRNPLCNLYLHQILRSDDDRALHDHPWFNISLILAGGYDEVLPISQHQACAMDYMIGHVRHCARVPGQLVLRGPHWRHRLHVSPRHGSTWTLFLTGPVMREWGFSCAKGWVPWRNFTSARDKGQIGAGCGGEARAPQRRYALDAWRRGE